MIRNYLGAWERPITNLYRSSFVNLGQFARVVRNAVPHAHEILEVGCGEGAMLEELARHYPDSRLTGIDITPKVGRMFRGDRERVTFRTETIEDFRQHHCAKFDLCIACDVLHHVPWDRHSSFVQALSQVVRPGGWLIIKDWERRRNIVHFFAYCSDTYITGDSVRYRTAREFRDVFAASLGPNRPIREVRISPWRNNLAFLIQL
jgi:2-polyprenyl-6-hydroxyphenyl methylase/3-demethylubiquinone-9 3-methyltransferase